MHNHSPTQPEKLLTIKELADNLGMKYWKVQRAAKRGEVPYYTPFNRRKLFKLSEVQALIDSSRTGGAA